MENLHLKVENATGDIVIREGKALDLLPPKKVTVTGDIKTVASFIKGRYGIGEKRNPGAQGIVMERAIVEVDSKAKTIVLSLDPQDPNGTVVTSKLEPNPDLAAFHINGKKTFSQKELVDLLKFSRLYFEDFGKHGDLLKAYQSFSAKVFSDLANEKDSRGNKSYAFNKKVETGLPETFVMNMPIFKGQDPRRFMVEICVDVTDNAVAFWFESVDLAEQTEIEGEKLLQAELESCKDFVVIWK